MVRPFKVNIPQEILDDLRQRLSNTRWPDEMKGADWSYGTNLGYLKTLVRYWREDFDWRAQEDRINPRVSRFILAFLEAHSAVDRSGSARR
jgi:Epoxide hydrolase N terminus